MTLSMGDCDNCADHQKRVELYADTDVGCGDEFYVPPDPCLECPDSCVNGECVVVVEVDPCDECPDSCENGVCKELEPEPEQPSDNGGGN